MPTFDITSPDGQKYRVTAPEGATEQDALAKVQAQHAEGPSLLSQAVKPITDIPGDIAGEFEAGAKDVKEGMESSPSVGGALKMASGAAQEAFSPITGAAKALVGDPLRAALPKGKASEIAAQTGEDVASMVGPGAVAKGVKAIGKALPGLSDSVKLLMNEGVNLTPGHMGGRAVKGAEDAVSSVPVAGSFVKSAQSRMFEDFNRAVVNRALKLVGSEVPKSVEAGRPMIAFAQKEIGKKYDELLPKLKWDFDTQLNSDIAALQVPSAVVPEAQQRQFGAVVDDVLDRMTRTPGALTGRDFKEIETNLSYLTRTYGKSPNPGDVEFSHLVDDLNGALRSSLERANPTRKDEIANLNTAWATFKRAEGASVRRGTSGGIFTPADLLADIKKSTSQSIFARGDATLQDLAEAGQEVLPQSIPNSGTIDRGLWAGALSGGYMMRPEWAAGAAAATAPYTKIGQAGVNALVRGAPRAGDAALDALSRTGPYAGVSQGAASALSQPAESQ